MYYFATRQFHAQIHAIMAFTFRRRTITGAMDYNTTQWSGFRSCFLLYRYNVEIQNQTKEDADNDTVTALIICRLVSKRFNPHERRRFGKLVMKSNKAQVYLEMKGQLLPPWHLLFWAGHFVLKMHRSQLAVD